MLGKKATLASWGRHGPFAPLNPPMSEFLFCLLSSQKTQQAVLQKAQPDT